MAVPTVSLKRSLGFTSIGASLAFAIALSACGGNGDETQPTIIIQPSSYSTIVSTTAAQASPSGQQANGGTVAGTQVYEVQSGDFISGIAADYGIPPESIANFNQWDDGLNHVIQPGDVINIPPGAQVPDADSDEDEEDSGSADEEEPDTTEEEDEEAASSDDEPRCPDGELQGTYTIEEGDFPGAVAESLNVTLDQLEEANANTPGYSAFIVGTDILVPCGDEE
jgi:LysM repeat protein